MSAPLVDPEEVKEFRRAVKVRALFGTDDLVAEFAVLAHIDALTAQLAEARRELEEARDCARVEKAIRQSFEVDLDDAHRQVDAFQTERDEARREWDAALEDAAGSLRIIERQARLLTDTANALRGDTPELVMWGHSDVPERARAMKAERDTARAALAAMRERVLACEVETFNGPCGGYDCGEPLGEMMYADDVRAAVEEK